MHKLGKTTRMLAPNADDPGGGGQIYDSELP
jgi:hypothetical protein